MKKNKKKIYLLKALAFPVSAWFAFTIGTAVVQAQDTDMANVDNQAIVETTSLQDDANQDASTTWGDVDQSGETSSSDSSQEVKKDTVSYETHVQNIGWQSTKENGELAGTTGQSKRLEAIGIQLDSQYEGSVNYQTHVQDYGWQKVMTDGELAGTTGQSKRLEAIRIWLSGDIANHYSVQYRVHVSNLGWLDWVSDGMIAGTTGRSIKIEGIQIQFIELLENRDLLQYTTHVQDIGWQNLVTSGQQSGTTGQSKRVEGIRVYFNDSQYAGNVIYQAHVQNIGWQQAVKNGGLAGTTGQSKRIEAIRMNLDGEVSQYYDIYYRVHSADWGWFDWAYDGAISGITGLAKRIEAIEIKLLAKGAEFISNSLTSIQSGVGYYGDGSSKDGTLSFGGVEYTSSKGVCYKVVAPVTYYSQRDGRWAGTVIGGYSFDGTGCAISVMTSVINKLLNTNYIPTYIGQIAHNAGYFNTARLAGTGGAGIVYLCNYFGLTCKSNLSFEAMKSELLSGHLIAGALGYNVPLCPWYGETHEVLLYGYNSVTGLANVNDPYNASNNGEYALSFIYSHPSNFDGDLMCGGPFFSIYKA